MRTIGTTRFVRGTENRATSQESKTGFHLAPFVKEVIRGRLPIHTTQTIILKGYHFDPKTNIALSDVTDAVIRKISFIDPATIEVVITSGRQLGRIPITVKNNGLEQTSPVQFVTVYDPSWVDLRNTPLDSLGIQATEGVILTQNNERGIFATGAGRPWDRGVKFTKHSWKRIEELEFSMVFVITEKEGFSKFGIGGSNINVNQLDNESTIKAETQMSYANGFCRLFQGGGLESPWGQEIGVSVAFEVDTFYKVKFHRSGINGTLMSISEVDRDNFNIEIRQLHLWTSDCPANDPILMPYWSAVSNPNVFLTAYKVG